MAMKTHYKEKLPGHLSYPLGLESVAAELGDIPQAEELSVRFAAHRDTATATERRRRVGQDYVVMAACFQHQRLGYSESNEMRDRGLYAPILEPCCIRREPETASVCPVAAPRARYSRSQSMVAEASARDMVTRYK